MATKSKSLNFDVNAWFEDISDQFRDLNPNEPGQWPAAPKAAAFSLVTIVVMVLGWVLVLSDVQTALDAEKDKEPKLRQDYSAKLSQAVNLPELRKQKSQVEEYVTQLEKQLPGKAEMDAMLSDINQAGVGRGLQFELFRPGQVVLKDFYAELPFSLRVSGRYHDIGAFTADISNLSRIVTLHNLSIVAPTGKDVASGTLAMEATARTYRYLDTGEVEEQKKSARAAGAKK
ncbi:type 4a pilus biogenesis protein PilO [Paucibacter sp. APW11]|uniref:Type 4a pilus biogenesis protein PilO n=1 Tax=Roseateles aquae TaxID=3077235 RepID=A0ABU3PI98_9BURK|nr:type 4a pilus biogenesis protein PilO [Paucibacter sp. APW11]MDT9002150.1 type 4a pilus biogenesis protein PilO [Paucibacter sp. APW11]